MTRRPVALLLLAALTLSACSANSNNETSGSSAAGAPNRTRGPAPDGPKAADGGEVRTSDEATSTFALDIDTASYTYSRAQILAGHLPASGQVRPEEFVNAFRQDYPQPAGNGFSINADGSHLPQSHATSDKDTARILRVGLQTRSDASSVRSDAALTFVVDVSGSMAAPGKLDLVQDALNTLIDQLRPSDSVAVVAYSDEAEVVLPMTSGGNRSTLHGAVEKLKISGSTNLEAGLLLGYETARKGFRKGLTNRVILLSDGLPNVGDTNAGSLVQAVQEAAAKQISLLGVGVGSDYGDSFMEQLADKGDGFVVYVSEQKQARKVFVEQLPATLAVRALDAKAQVQFDPEVVSSYRLIGYDDRTIAASDFRNDKVDGGEVGPGHTVTALYALHLTSAGAAGSAKVADVRVRWADPATRTPTELTEPVLVRDLDGAFTDASPRLRVCYAAGYFAEALAGTSLGKEVKLTDLGAIAKDAASRTEDSDVDDLVKLIGAAARLD